METLTAKEISVVTGGTLHGDQDVPVTGVSVDSRKCAPGHAFFALRGTALDGAGFARDAVGRGASAVVASHGSPIDADGACVIRVQDSFSALQALAASYRSRFPIPALAVTGSSGKTTTKDILASILSRAYVTVKTRGNLNSSTGAPLSVFEMDSSHEIAVFELSMSGEGEILGNAAIIRPETAVITNIGVAHLMQLGSREAIFRAKCEILAYMDGKGTAVLNAGDEYLSRIRPGPFGIVRYGIGEGDVSAHRVTVRESSTSFMVRIGGEPFGEFTFPALGDHMVLDCLASIAAGVKYSMTAQQVQEGFDAYVPSENRMQVIRSGGLTLINDTYNANPDSMMAAINALCATGATRRVAVLGDMLELGESASELTRGVGRHAASAGVDLLLGFGENAPCLAEGFGGAGESYMFTDKEALAGALGQMLRPGDAVLFKGSRGMRLEETFAAVKERIS